MSGITAPLTGRGKERRRKPAGGNTPAIGCGWSPSISAKSGTSGKVPRKTPRVLSGRAVKVTLTEVIARLATSGMSLDVIRIKYVEDPRAGVLEREAAIRLLEYASRSNK